MFKLIQLVGHFSNFRLKFVISKKLLARRVWISPAGSGLTSHTRYSDFFVFDYFILVNSSCKDITFLDGIFFGPSSESDQIFKIKNMCPKSEQTVRSDFVKLKVLSSAIS